jgi:hypothetical protein
MRVTSWLITALSVAMLVGIISLFFILENEAGTACASETYHSAECKDIRGLQSVSVLVGAALTLVLGLGVLSIYLLRRKGR